MTTTAAGISSTTVTTDQQAPLGFQLEVPNGDLGLQIWTYVLADEAFVIGDIAIVNSDYGHSYHAIQSNGDEPKVRVLGVAQHVIALNSYGFVLSRGYATYVKGDGSVAAGDAIVPHTAGVADTLDTDQGDMVFGYALAADAANLAATGHSVDVFAAQINCGV